MATVEQVHVGPLPTQVVRTGSGPVLVYLHGVLGLRDDDPLVRRLAERFEVVAPIHPGFADLSELDHLRDVHDLALHYDSLLDALELTEVAVLGHSYGGMVAAELAAHVPARVATLVLAAPFGIWRDAEPMPDIFRAYPLQLDDLLWANGAQPVAPTAGDSPDLERFLSMAQGMTAVGKFMWPLPDKGLERRLHRIRARTLIAWGTADKVVPRSYVEAFVAGIGGATMHTIDGGGHMAPAEQIDGFAALLEDFVVRTAPARA